MTKRVSHQSVGSELLVYQADSCRCHLFNEQAASVQEMLHENLAEVEIVARFRARFPEYGSQAAEIVEEVARYSRGHGLLEERSEAANAPARRDFLKVAGLLLVTSVLAPVPAHAASNNALTIISAPYGNFPGRLPDTNASCPGGAVSGVSATCDATSFLAGQVTGPGGNTINVGISNVMCGDPISGVRKEAIITYRCGASPPVEARVCEGVSFNVTCP